MASGFYLPRVWLGSKVSPKLLPSKIRPLAAHVKLTENCQAKCISCNYWQTRWQDGINTDRAIALSMNSVLWAYAHCGLPAENRCSARIFSNSEQVQYLVLPEHHHPNQRSAAQEASQGNERFADHERGGLD